MYEGGKFTLKNWYVLRNSCINSSDAMEKKLLSQQNNESEIRKIEKTARE